MLPCYAMSQVKYLTVIAQSLVSKVRSYKMAGWSGFKRLYTLDAHTHTHTYTHAHTHTLNMHPNPPGGLGTANAA